MHLAEIEIKHFRNLNELTVRLGAGLNVVVGRNNVGKTNLFEAIRHCLGPVASVGDNLWLADDDFTRTDDRCCSFEPIRITLVFDELTEAQEAQFFEILALDPRSKESARAVINLEATWDGQRRRVRTERWGGLDDADRPPIPQEILAALPVTYLPALRDAERALQPGRRSRLALLLRDLIERSDAEKATAFGQAVQEIFATANARLLDIKAIEQTASRLSSTTKELAGIDHVPSSLSAGDPTLARVLQTLQVVLSEGPTAEIYRNGLGSNNLLFIAMVLAHLAAAAHETPILLIEEPEAHLHPQLVQLLGDYFAKKVAMPQTIVSSHSAALAASVKPTQIVLLHRAGGIRSSSMAKLALSQPEERQLQRMMDITRAALYFARGVILVEGVSEELLLPVLAKRLGYDLRERCVSVIPICGVSFSTFKRLLADDGLSIPVSIVTDADPPITRGDDWRTDVPEAEENGQYKISARAQNVSEEFAGRSSVRVLLSKVTLEFDLADAGPANPELMVRVWEEGFERTPGTLNIGLLGGAESKPLTVWRGICRASHTGSKAEFAHRLAQRLEDVHEAFSIPEYIRRAVTHACGEPGACDTD